MEEEDEPDLHGLKEQQVAMNTIGQYSNNVGYIYPI